MTEPHKRPHRHPKYKTTYRVKNWREYEQSLRDRGDITLWISPEAIAAWRAPMTGTRGAQPIYADIAIETALALRLLFHLPLRQMEGLLGAVLRLMGLSLPSPDHTTLSRRHATVAIRRQVNHAPQGPIDLIVDSSGFKICGQGEWHAQKHGEKQCKRWEKLHLGVDAQGQILASTLTESHAQDPSQVPELLSSGPRHRALHRGWYVRSGAGLRRCSAAFPRSPGDRPAPQGCRVEQPGRDLPDTTRWAYFGNRERRAISLETNVGLLCAEPR